MTKTYFLIKNILPFCMLCYFNWERNKIVVIGFAVHFTLMSNETAENRQAMIGISCRKNLGKSRSKSQIYYRDRKMIRSAQPIVSETIKL